MPYANDAAKREDPILGFSFSIDVGGTITGYFTEVTGLGSENDIIESKFINDKGVEVIQKYPGRLKWGDITLKKGLTTSLNLWDWRRLVEDGKMGDARKNGSIIMYDRENKEAARWNFVNGWPSKIAGPAPKSDSNEIGIEEVTIVHEFIERVK